MLSIAMKMFILVLDEETKTLTHLKGGLKTNEVFEFFFFLKINVIHFLLDMVFKKNSV